jgi:hypothetical protein
MGVATLLLYAVRNRDGLWFRSRGIGGYGETWVAELQDAKLYSRIGPARSRVTFFAARWPEYGTPDVVELSLSGMRVLDETKRAAKAIERKRTEKEEREVRERAYELKSAERALEDAKARLEKAKRVEAGRVG